MLYIWNWLLFCFPLHLLCLLKESTESRRSRKTYIRQLEETCLCSVSDLVTAWITTFWMWWANKIKELRAEFSKDQTRPYNFRWGGPETWARSWAFSLQLWNDVAWTSVPGFLRRSVQPAAPGGGPALPWQCRGLFDDQPLWQDVQRLRDCGGGKADGQRPKQLPGGGPRTGRKEGRTDKVIYLLVIVLRHISS